MRGRLPDSGLERVIAEPSTDSDGNEASRITVVLKPEAARDWTGDQALDLLVAIQETLTGEGEERLPIVHYATETDLEPSGEPDERESADDED